MQFILLKYTFLFCRCLLEYIIYTIHELRNIFEHNFKTKLFRPKPIPKYIKLHTRWVDFVRSSVCVDRAKGAFMSLLVNRTASMCQHRAYVSCTRRVVATGHILRAHCMTHGWSTVAITTCIARSVNYADDLGL